MEELRLVRPSLEHRRQYEEMMEEWESFGGRLSFVSLAFTPVA